tara:strand:- start:5858 stop:7192 length:1335 start_codon:yes stop_codon:yes gene_type:complete
MNMKRLLAVTVILTGLALSSTNTPLAAQFNAESRGSDNIKVLSHLPIGAPGSVSDIEIEQDLSRPFAYIGREVLGRSDGGERGVDVIDIADPSNPKVIYRWRIEDNDLHIGAGGKDLKIFSWEGRHYLILSVQFRQGGPDYDLGAIVFDVTGLPDTSTFKEVARIQGPEELGGFHNIFTYKHSNGRALLFATTTSPAAHVYDLGYVVDGKKEEALVARVPVPGPDARSYHDFYTGYDADSEQDRFYGGGTGGYYVFNVTDLESPELLVSLTGINGVEWGHTFTPSPDGRYVVAEAEYQYAPLRIFDLKPGLDGEVTNIRRPISAWTANWEHLVHNHEVRWPLVFVSGYLDGLQIFSLQDPKRPKTVGHYDTYLEGDEDGVMNGAWGVDVRNEDGLIVISDMVTGFWAFKMEGFDGWNGLDWGYPNMSSVQDWDNGPAVQVKTRN